MALSAGISAAIGVFFGVVGERDAGALVASLPWLSRRPHRRTLGAALAVAEPLTRWETPRTALPSADEVGAALLRRLRARQGAALQWTPLIALAAVAASAHPDPDLLIALAAVFPLLGCVLLIDRAFDIRSNRRDHVAERAADALAMVLALDRDHSKAPAGHTAAARLPHHCRRLRRVLRRAAG